MSKPFLIIQLRPEDETADNEFSKILEFGELQSHDVQRLRIEVSGLPELNLDSYAAIIVGGSPFDLSAPQTEKSEIQLQIEQAFMNLFEEIKRRDFPFLGCCSGNGLLGAYCGASISRKFGEPVGGATVSLTDVGKQDPLLAGLPASFRVMLGHKEACDDVPPGCELLVSGHACPVQMFRLRENIYATQFHPEGDAEGFAVRIEAYKHHGYFPALEADQLLQRIAAEETPEAKLILKRFVQRYRDQAQVA
jgi:GMP synthase (glutamine-hydrolysing)